MKTGIELIAEERQEQIEKHGRTVDKDVEQNDCYELKLAASALLEYSSDDKDEIVSIGHFPGAWDIYLCEKMAHKPYKERLIIAGALIAAEIDRIQNQQEYDTEINRTDTFAESRKDFAPKKNNNKSK